MAYYNSEEVKTTEAVRNILKKKHWTPRWYTLMNSILPTDGI